VNLERNFVKQYINVLLLSVSRLVQFLDVIFLMRQANLQIDNVVAHMRCACFAGNMPSWLAIGSSWRSTNGW